MNRKFLVWCHERKMWWKPAYGGYTLKRDEAGRYSFDDAMQICLEANLYNREDEPAETMVADWGAIQGAISQPAPTTF